jgi:hypothetical protein
MSEQAPAGWYPQSDGTQRYWDGQQWTDHTAPGAADAAPATAEVSPAAPVATAGDARPWFNKTGFLIPGGAAILFFLFVAMAAAGGGGGTPEAQTTPTEDASVSTPTPSPTDVADTASADAAPVAFSMPDVVGMNLQEAQDSLQALGSYLMDQQDASGAGRVQVIDSNWQVCTQDPAAGTDADATTIVTLGAVKLDEVCPGAEASGDDEAAPSDEVAMTTSQEQAVRKAEDYLDYTAFSRSGLIDQLVYEGFSKKDSTFAVDYLNVNWKQQAALKAQEYLDYTAFSHKGLVDQLEYEGFTHKQAEYGVKQVGL